MLQEWVEYLWDNFSFSQSNIVKIPNVESWFVNSDFPNTEHDTLEQA